MNSRCVALYVIDFAVQSRVVGGQTVELRTDRITTQRPEGEPTLRTAESLVEERNAQVEAAQAGSLAYAQAIEEGCAQDMQRLQERIKQHKSTTATAREKLLASTQALDERRAQLAERLREQGLAAFAEAL